MTCQPKKRHVIKKLLAISRLLRRAAMILIKFFILQRTLTRELELPLRFEETIHEVSNEDDEESSRYRELRQRLSRSQFTHHGNTL